MLQFDEIQKLLQTIDQTSVSEFELSDHGFKITVKKGLNGAVVLPAPVFHPQTAAAPAAPVQPAPAAPALADAPKAPEAPAANLLKIASPMVGTFYASSSPDKPAFVAPGSKVGERTVVCIVEAMKLFNEIEAEVSGEIVEVLAKNGELVEYGQTLFLVKPNV